MRPSQLLFFVRKLIVILLIIFGGSSLAQAQQSDIYMIENTPATATAKSAGDAKIIATNNARRNAFISLLSRLNLSPAIAENVTVDEIFDMVRLEQITDEKIAGNNYSANFNILFAKNAVDQVLKNKSLKKDDANQDAYLLIPAQIIKDKTKVENNQKFLLWEEENEWKKAVAEVLKTNLKTKAQNKFIIPQNDFSNVTILNQENIDQLEYSTIEPLFARYKVAGAYLIFFYFDNIENKVSITVKDIRKLQKKQVKLSFINVDRLDHKALLDKVADKTIEYLINSQSYPAAKIANIIKLEVQINSLNNWLTMKSKIENSNLINQMNIEAIAKDYVRISVNYVGSDPDVISTFAKFGLTLIKKTDNFFIIPLN
ncbi:MAG: DUF2066 domain-containing protein [Rickettsiales bacterium]|nr:DUF2066 domain-containing protein [Rickettsiales bacterium]